MVQTDSAGGSESQRGKLSHGQKFRKNQNKRGCDSYFWVTGSQVLMDDVGRAGLFTGPERKEAGTTERNSRTRSGKSHDRSQEKERWGQCRNPGGETQDS